MCWSNSTLTLDLELDLDLELKLWVVVVQVSFALDIRGVVQVSFALDIRVMVWERAWDMDMGMGTDVGMDMGMGMDGIEFGTEFGILVFNNGGDMFIARGVMGKGIDSGKGKCIDAVEAGFEVELLFVLAFLDRKFLAIAYFSFFFFFIFREEPSEIVFETGSWRGCGRKRGIDGGRGRGRGRGIDGGNWRGRVNGVFDNEVDDSGEGRLVGVDCGREDDIENGKDDDNGDDDDDDNNIDKDAGCSNSASGAHAKSIPTA